MKKKLKKIKTDKAAKNLLDQDLSDYINKDNFKKVTFEFAPKDKSVTVRMSDGLLKAVKHAAKGQGTNYQKFIREALEFYLKNVS